MQLAKNLRDKPPDIRERSPREERRENNWRRLSSQEDDRLFDLVKAANHWNECADQVPCRTTQSCETHWTTKLMSEHPDIVDPTCVKFWMLEKDEALVSHIQDGRDWIWISRQLVGRSFAACMGRWHGDGAGLDATTGLKHSYPDIV